MKKKVFACLLTAVVTAGLICAAAFAEDAYQVETKTMAETDEFVRAGFGIGAVMLDVPEKAAEPGGDVFEVKTRKTVPQGRYLAVYRKGTQLTAAAREFLAGVRRGIAP